MVRSGHFWPKNVWKSRVWKHAWELYEWYWRVRARCSRSLYLLSNICEGADYNVWWQISDKVPGMMSVKSWQDWYAMPEALRVMIVNLRTNPQVLECSLTVNCTF